MCIKCIYVNYLKFIVFNVKRLFSRRNKIKYFNFIADRILKEKIISMSIQNFLVTLNLTIT